VGESWTIEAAGATGADTTASVSPEDAPDVIRSRIAGGHCETWLISSVGRSLAINSNGARAMVMLLDEPGDPGGHAIDPGAEGRSDGFILDNGQHDQYADVDTVPLAEALQIVSCILRTGAPAPGTPWKSDR
jgi:hypothetical protein